MADTKKPRLIVKDYRLFELETIAAQALADAAACVRGRRVDVERLILEKFGLRIEAFYDLRRKWDTYAFIDTKGQVIFVDAALMDNVGLEKKYRFTLAEELAHFLIHSNVFAACKTPEDRLRLEKQLDDQTRDNLESNARALASAILMPKATQQGLSAEVETLRHRQTPAGGAEGRQV
ncbi:MAG: ImmA/IrrE family metallo-endopeptidase [Verrucomicrobia bacterium]|nr:ImmA/IrrE family metallo-endopeptidase [Verrucomicrobiota bacterium]